MAAAPRVDIHPTSTRVTRIDGELGRFAARPNIHKDALHAMLMKFIVVAKTHDVLQQTSLVNLRPAVADADTAPVGLTRHQTIAFQQVTVKRLCDRRFVKGGAE